MLPYGCGPLYAHVRKEFFDLAVVPVVPVVKTGTADRRNACKIRCSSVAVCFSRARTVFEIPVVPVVSVIKLSSTDKRRVFCDVFMERDILRTRKRIVFRFTCRTRRIRRPRQIRQVSSNTDKNAFNGMVMGDIYTTGPS